MCLFTLTIMAQQTYVVDQPLRGTDHPYRRDYFATQLLFQTLKNGQVTGFSAVTFLTDEINRPYKRMFQWHRFANYQLAKEQLEFHLIILSDFYKKSFVYKNWNKNNQSHWGTDFSIKNATQPNLEALTRKDETIEGLEINEPVKLE